MRPVDFCISVLTKGKENGKLVKHIW